MLVNAKAQMLCSNTNKIELLNQKLIQNSIEDDKLFFETIKLQEEIINKCEKQLSKIIKET